MEYQTKNLRDYLRVLRRRKWQFLVVAAGLFCMACAVALWLPSIYRSTATILIEQQEIPSEFLGLNISSFADQRIQVISQQAMSRASLMRIIEKHGLYGIDPQKGKASYGNVQRLRKDVNLELVKADVADQRGSMTTATIAFNLSYDGESPELAQRVATELAALFVESNIRERREQAAQTSSFFAAEASKLSERISRAEARLASFKARNIGRLPEQVQLNLQQRERIESEISETERQISAVEERKFYLQGELAQVKPTGPLISPTGERILDEAERLRQLQTRYASLAGVYSDNHPDMVKMRREIEALESEVGVSTEVDERRAQIVRLRGDLITAREKYSDNHPDVIRLKKAIDALETSIQASAGRTSVRDTRPDNPAYITLQSQLDSANNEIKNLRRKRTELKSSIGVLDSRLAQAPQVEKEYLDLVRAYEEALKRYEDVRGKQVQAQVAQQLEKEAKGERFLLLDPPQLPEHPHSPNRIAIVFLGLLLSVGGGAAYAGVMEALDDSIHDSSALNEVSEAPLLAVIPYVEGKKRKRHTDNLSLSPAMLPAGVALAPSLSGPVASDPHAENRGISGTD